MNTRAHNVYIQIEIPQFNLKKDDKAVLIAHPCQVMQEILDENWDDLKPEVVVEYRGWITATFNMDVAHEFNIRQDIEFKSITKTDMIRAIRKVNSKQIPAIEI